MLLLAGLFMVVEGAAIGLIVYMIQPMFDQVFLAADPGAMLWVALLLFAILLARALGGFIQRVLVMRVGLGVITQIQRDLLQHLLRLDLDFFNQNGPGSLIERVRGDAQALQSFASNALITLGRDSISLLSLLIVALLIDWRWTLIALIGIPLLILPIAGVQKWILRTSRQARKSAAQLSNRLDEIFHGIKAIKLYGVESHEHQRFGQQTDLFLQAQQRAETGKAVLPAIIDVVAGLGFAAVVIYGGQQIITGDKTLGQFVSFFGAMLVMFDPLRRLSNVSGAISMASASLERIYELFDQQARIISPAELAQPLNWAQADIEFSQVCFAYGEQPVHRQLSFVAKAGQMTAFVGSSGSGKSTIFNLLARLIEPSSGAIRLGHVALSSLPLAPLRQQLAVVSQESALFDESLADNIRLGHLAASDAQVQAAAEQALVTEFAQAWPDGLDTVAGPRGSNLSGGQRQRIVIARALLRQSPILLLDEATSALDNQTEQRLQQLLLAQAQGKTTLVIAHRLSTVRQADCIHVLDQGQVVESGTHEQLMAMAGHYHRLHRQLAE